MYQNDGFFGEFFVFHAIEMHNLMLTTAGHVFGRVVYMVPMLHD